MRNLKSYKTTYQLYNNEQKIRFTSLLHYYIQYNINVTVKNIHSNMINITLNVSKRIINQNIFTYEKINRSNFYGYKVIKKVNHEKY